MLSIASQCSSVLEMKNVPFHFVNARFGRYSYSLPYQLIFTSLCFRDFTGITCCNVILKGKMRLFEMCKKINVLFGHEYSECVINYDIKECGCLGCCLDKFNKTCVFQSVLNGICASLWLRLIW